MAFEGILCPEEPTTEAAEAPLADNFFALAADLATELIPFPFDGLFDADTTLDLEIDTKCGVPMGRVPDGIAGPETAEGIIFSGVESRP